MRPGTKALAAGASAGLLLILFTFVSRATAMVTEDVATSIYLGGAFNGLVACGAVLALTRLPIAARPSPRAAWIAGGLLFALSALGLPGVRVLAFPAVVGYAMGLFTAELLPESAPMSSRLAVALGSTGALFVSALLSGVVAGRLMMDTSGTVGQALLMCIAALATMGITLKVALRRQVLARIHASVA